MRRSSVTQKIVGYFFAYILFALYCYFSDIFVFLPPLLGIFFVLFSHALERNNIPRLAFLIAMLFWLECDRGLPFGIILVIYLLLYIGVYRPFVFLFKKNISILCLCVCYFVLFLLFALIGNYGATLRWWEIFGIFAYYALLEGIVIGTLKI